MGILLRLALISTVGVLGYLIGREIVKIVVEIYERITAYNLARHARNALKNNAETRDAVEGALQVCVDSFNGNSISLSALKNGEKIAEITMKAQEIDSSIKVGMTTAI